MIQMLGAVHLVDYSKTMFKDGLEITRGVPLCGKKLDTSERVTSMNPFVTCLKCTELEIIAIQKRIDELKTMND